MPQIDGALTEFGMPVGPFGMQDIAGIDVGARIRQYLKSIGKTRAEGPQSEVPDRLFEMGRYGQKTGAGWYRYEAGQPQPHSRSAGRADRRRSGREARHHAPRGHGRRDHRADHDGARQRRRARARRGLRDSRQRHRRRSTATASASRVIAAARCSTPTRSGCRRCSRGSSSIATRFGDYWKPAPLLEKLVAEGKGFNA